MFRTDEAIMSPDFVTNDLLMCAYDAGNREFVWTNRGYTFARSAYNEFIKKSKEQNQVLAESKKTKKTKMYQLLKLLTENFA